MTYPLDDFWANVDAALNRCAEATIVEDVITILNEHFNPSSGAAFFGGSGGIDDLSVGEKFTMPMEMGCQIARCFGDSGSDDEPQPGIVEVAQVGRREHAGIGNDNDLVGRFFCVIFFWFCLLQILFSRRMLTLPLLKHTVCLLIAACPRDQKSVYGNKAKKPQHQKQN